MNSKQRKKVPAPLKLPELARITRLTEAHWHTWTNGDIYEIPVGKERTPYQYNLSTVRSEMYRQAKLRDLQVTTTLLNNKRKLRFWFTPLPNQPTNKANEKEK